MSDDGDLLAMLFGLWGLDEDEDELGVLLPGPQAPVPRLTRRQRRAARRAARRGEPPPGPTAIPIEIELRFEDDDLP